MQWVEDFHVLAREDQSAANRAGAELDEIMAILDAGLTRSRGTQAADVQAHIGWAHWLNQHIAEREFGPAAEKNLRAALSVDPTNVYANAMLGNWMLQNGGDFSEAIHHLDVAVSTGKARAFVRELQVGGLISLSRQGARAELVKAANDMRKSDEVLGDWYKSRISSFCFDSMMTNHKELLESLSAVPPDDAWDTYMWLDGNPEERQPNQFAHDFVHANFLEVKGKPREALDEYQALQRKLKNSPGSMKNSVDAAIVRLSH